MVGRGGRQPTSAAAPRCGAPGPLDDRRAQVQGALRPLGRALGRWVARDRLRWPVPGGRTGAVASGDDVEVTVLGLGRAGRVCPESLARNGGATAPTLR